MVTRGFTLSSFLVLTALGALRAEPPAPFTPRATIGHYNGNTGVNTPLWSGVNGDVPAVVVAAAVPPAGVFGPLVGNADNAKAVVGQMWGPLLNIGTCAVGAGVAIVRLRPTAINGPNVVLPGGCIGEVLHGGTLLGTINAPHGGVVCNVPNQPIPTSAIGMPWAAQATLRGAAPGGTELSSVIYGIVDICF